MIGYLLLLRFFVMADAERKDSDFPALKKETVDWVDAVSSKTSWGRMEAEEGIRGLSLCWQFLIFLMISKIFWYQNHQWSNTVALLVLTVNQAAPTLANRRRANSSTAWESIFKQEITEYHLYTYPSWPLSSIGIRSLYNRSRRRHWAEESNICGLNSKANTWPSPANDVSSAYMCLYHCRKLLILQTKVRPTRTTSRYSPKSQTYKQSLPQSFCRVARGGSVGDTVLISLWYPRITWFLRWGGETMQTVQGGSIDGFAWGISYLAAVRQNPLPSFQVLIMWCSLCCLAGRTGNEWPFQNCICLITYHM